MYTVGRHYESEIISTEIFKVMLVSLENFEHFEHFEHFPFSILLSRIKFGHGVGRPLR